MADTSETGSRSINPRAPGTRGDEVSAADPRIADGIEHRIRPARTSVAAASALVFGVSALTCALSVVLAPVALVLGLIGIIVGAVGFKMAKRVGITGKGVAITGLLLSLLAVVLAGILAVGITTVLNDDRAVARLEQEVQDLRGQLPADINVPQP